MISSKVQSKVINLENKHLHFGVTHPEKWVRSCVSLCRMFQDNSNSQQRSPPIPDWLKDIMLRMSQVGMDIRPFECHGFLQLNQVLQKSLGEWKLA